MHREGSRRRRDEEDGCPLLSRPASPAGVERDCCERRCLRCMASERIGSVSAWTSFPVPALFFLGLILPRAAFVAASNARVTIQHVMNHATRSSEDATGGGQFVG